MATAEKVSTTMTEIVLVIAVILLISSVLDGFLGEEATSLPGDFQAEDFAGEQW